MVKCTVSILLCLQCAINSNQLLSHALIMDFHIRRQLSPHCTNQRKMEASSKAISSLLVFVAIFLSLLTESSCQNEVYVDPLTGNDTECLSLQEIQDGQTSTNSPCRTLNQALGNVDCRRAQFSCSDAGLENAIVWLLDGVHQLSDCIAIIRGSNITVQAQNPGQAVVVCPENSNPNGHQFISCNTEGITFRGIRFENCGPRSNLFLNRSSNVLIEDCSFS